MLSGKFKNCYGIKEFDLGKGIDFSKSNKALIYAPNGVMKTSFAKVFEDLSKGEPSKDRIFKDSMTSYSINYYNKNYEYSSSNARSISSCDKIYVINSFSDNFEFTKETVSTLLADEVTRSEYNDLLSQFAEQIKELETELVSKSGLSKTKLIDTLINDLGLSSTADWPDIINIIHELLGKEENVEYLGKIKLAILFHDKAVKEYEKPEFKEYIQQYIDRLADLLKESDLLSTSFTDRSAEALTKTFSSNNLFSAQHKIVLRDGTKICSVNEWKFAVESQLQKMYTDETLHNVFEKLKKSLTANNDVDAARKIIIEYRRVIPLLFDISGTKKKMWVAYFSQMKRPFSEYYSEITKFAEQVRVLYERAASHSERWQQVVEEFNRRFRVPFTVKINNKSNFILKDEAPNISFVYKQGNGINEKKENLTKSSLLPFLSMGEKRAMYLLYILFDLDRIRLQAEKGQKYLVIADDIADSFDYKNKYAIIEYLADLSENSGIDLLMLTHNFDFYRTVSSRLNIPRNNCYIAQKDSDGKIKLEVFRYQRDFFKNVILNGIKGKDKYRQKKMLVASIPFYRNLAEYCGNEDDFLSFTCFLHYKSAPIDTSHSTLSDLWRIVKKYINGSTLVFDNDNYYDTVQATATDISKENDDISLEDKLIFSIASRLNAEKYLKHVIEKHEKKCDDSTKNQLREWYNKAKPYLSDNEKRLMDDIILITPESIHLNAFMYEPLIDVSIWALNDIFDRTVKLEKTIT